MTKYIINFNKKKLNHKRTLDNYQITGPISDFSTITSFRIGRALWKISASNRVKLHK